VTCFVVRKKFRRQGLSRLLLREAIVFAQSQGAECIEGYPFDLERGTSRGDLYLGVGILEGDVRHGNKYLSKY
jgi:GNAT superfamily N-acetyltransferase